MFDFKTAAWESFRDFIPEDERNCFIAAYLKRLTSSDANVQVGIYISF
jgi:proline iminopeptidase